MRMKAPAVLVAISVSVSACASTGTTFVSAFDAAGVGAFDGRGGLHRSTLDRSVPQAPTASPYAPPPTSFATSRTRYEDPLPPPSSPPPPTTAPDANGQSTLEALASGVVLLGAGVLYLGHKIKHGPSRDDGFTIKRNGWHSRVRVRPTPTGLAVKF